MSMWGKTAPLGWGKTVQTVLPQPNIYNALWLSVPKLFLFFSSIDMMIKHVEMFYGVLNIIACKAINVAVLLF